MPHYEYRVVPAPAKGLKAKGVRGHEARFAYALQDLMNRMGADGWEYQRAETLPSEERHGLTSTTTTFRNVLVFRRIKIETPAPAPRLLAPPDPVPADDTTPEGFFSAARDNGVEDAEDMGNPAAALLKARARQIAPDANETAPEDTPAAKAQD